MALLVTIISLGVAGAAHGHGTGSETLPPIEMDGRMVTMVVSSAQEEGMVRVDMSMVVDDTGEAIPDTTYMITSWHGQTLLFSQEFHQDNGRIVFELTDGAAYMPPESVGGGFFGILGPSSYRVAGPGLAGGGLYSFDIMVLSADGHGPNTPPIFESAVSVPITYDDTIDGGRWGEQSIRYITYYDVLYERRYDPMTGRIYFEMPFEWDRVVIEQIETVHVEFTIPSSFGDLLVSDMEARVNGLPTPPMTVTIDDYYADVRTVHIVLPRGLLLELLEETGGGSMTFEVGAAPYAPYSAVTTNGEYRILLGMESARLITGGQAVIPFNITSVFLRSINVEAAYAAVVTTRDTTLHEQLGISGADTLKFSIPDNVSGPALISFHDVGGNELADASLPVFIEPGVQTPPVPSWIRETVSLWTAGDIDDGVFTAAISYMIQEGIIPLRDIPQEGGEGGPIDDWVRTTAEWWVKGQVSDGEFLDGLKYLIGRGIIHAP